MRSRRYFASHHQRIRRDRTVHMRVVANADSLACADTLASADALASADTFARADTLASADTVASADTFASADTVARTVPFSSADAFASADTLADSIKRSKGRRWRRDNDVDFRFHWTSRSGYWLGFLCTSYAQRLHQGKQHIGINDEWRPTHSGD